MKHDSLYFATKHMAGCDVNVVKNNLRGNARVTNNITAHTEVDVDPVTIQKTVSVTSKIILKLKILVTNQLVSPKFLADLNSRKINKTRMHSSRMRIVRFGGHH